MLFGVVWFIGLAISWTWHHTYGTKARQVLRRERRRDMQFAARQPLFDWNVECPEYRKAKKAS